MRRRILVVPIQANFDQHVIFYLRIERLFHFHNNHHHNFDDNIIFAVQDSRIRYISCSWGGINNYKELGLKAKSKFFNTGVLFIDLKKWKDEKISEKVIICNKKNEKYVKYWDQYGLNVVLSDKWRELDSCWNQFPEITAVDPYILHYVGRKPIDKDYLI